MISPDPYSDFRLCTLSIASLLSLLLLISPLSLFSQDNSPPSADFNGNGVVDIPDFLLFVNVFGLKEGQERYESKYDLDGNGEIGIPDFLIFVNNFGKVVTPRDEPTAAVPSNVVVEEGDSKLTVRWDAVPDEEGKPSVSGYEVRYRERDADDSVEWAVVEPTSSRLDTSVTITGVLNGQAYLVSVRTLVDGGGSEWSSPVLGIPVRRAAGPIFSGGGGGGGTSPPPPRPLPTPEVTIFAYITSVTEGTTATFTVIVIPAPASALTVNVTVTQTGNVISRTPSSSVTIDATGQATLTVETDDEIAEPPGVITAEVETGTGYTVGSISSASVIVNDNDNIVPPPLPPRSSVVTISDANLRAVIENRLGKARGAPITTDEMSTLTLLLAPGANISDLTGLEFATRLTSLNFNSNSISDEILSNVDGTAKSQRLPRWVW